MPTYTDPTSETMQTYASELAKHHPELHGAEVQVKILMAHGKRDKNGDLVGSAIKVRGCRAAGAIKITSAKDRAAGLADAVMYLDGDRWDEWSPEEQAALIDHELTHLELCCDSDGAVKRDDQDRPKLCMRPHDREFGWFDAVARRHGKHSFERSQFAEFHEGAYKQLWLNFAADDTLTAIADDADQKQFEQEVFSELTAAGVQVQRLSAVSRVARGRGVTKTRRRKIATA